MSNCVEDLDKDIDEYEEPPIPNWTSDEGSGENGQCNDQAKANRVGVAEANARPLA